MKIDILQANKTDLEVILQLRKECYQSEAEIYEDFSIPPLQQTIHLIEQEFQRCKFLKAVNVCCIIIHFQITTD